MIAVHCHTGAVLEKKGGFLTGGHLAAQISTVAMKCRTNLRRGADECLGRLAGWWQWRRFRRYFASILIATSALPLMTRGGFFTLRFDAAPRARLCVFAGDGETR